ncbi:universal stress protein [Pedobacter panaciterrae]
MKNFLAVFDGYQLNKSTLEYALLITKRSNGHLTGVFLDAFFYHNYNLSRVLNTASDPEAALKELNEKEQLQRDESVYEFQRACELEGISYAIHRDTSVALFELQYESMFADLIIINEQEKFTRSKDQQSHGFIKELLADVQCPVLVVPDRFREFEQIVLLYDGSPSSLYAIKMFSYLFDGWNTFSVEVLSVNESTNELALIPGNVMMKDFIDMHFSRSGFNLLNGKAEEKILAYLTQTSKNKLVVLGAYRRSQFSRWFKHSLADTLMKELDLPLFIAHQ